MKLYPKQLNSIEALERERRRLKREIAETDPIDIFGTKSARGKKKRKAKRATVESDETGGNNSLLITITELLTSVGGADVVLSLIGPLLGTLGRKAGKSFIKPVAKEVLGGYVKWKLIEISYKTALRFIRKKQHTHHTSK